MNDSLKLARQFLDPDCSVSVIPPTELIRRLADENEQLQSIVGQVLAVASSGRLPDGDHPCQSTMIWLEELAAEAVGEHPPA